MQPYYSIIFMIKYIVGCDNMHEASKRIIIVLIVVLLGCALGIGTPIVVKNIKEDTGLSDVPFLLGGLGDYLLDYPPVGIFKNYPVINDAMKKVSAALPMTGFVSAVGLTPNPDNLHFSAKSLHNFGLRYFEEFKKHYDKNKVFTEKPMDDLAIRTEMENL